MISRIPNPKFVLCKVCIYRKPRKRFYIGKVNREWYCAMSGRKLRGKKGCEEGQRKLRRKQETLE